MLADVCGHFHDFYWFTSDFDCQTGVIIYGDYDRQVIHGGNLVFHIDRSPVKDVIIVDVFRNNGKQSKLILTPE